MTAQSIISRYNHMNGNAVSGATLREFHDSIQKYLDRSGSGPFTHSINGIRKRLAAVLNSVKTNDVVEVRVKLIDTENVPAPVTVKKKLAAPAPTKKRKKKTKPAPQVAAVPVSKKEKRKTFKPKSRGKKPAKKKIDLRKLRHYIDGYLSIEKEIQKLIKRTEEYTLTPKEYQEQQKRVEKLEADLQIQVEQSAKNLKISEKEFIGRVNNYTENKNSLVEQLEGKNHRPKNRKSKIVNHKSLHGVVDAQTLAGISYSTFDLAPEWKKEFHKINSDSVLMIWGKPGSGKTVKLLKLAQHLSMDLKKKVLYIAEEEYGRSTLADKLTEHKIGNGNLSFAPDMDEKILSHFDAIFLDSVNSMHLTPADIKDLIRKYPGKLWVLIVQTTKEGDFRGGRDWEHLVDIAGEVVNRKMILRKNRLDPNNKAKADKLMVDEIVTEKKQAQEIKDLVKQKIEGEQKQQAA